ncbi:DUF5431 family protein (plasmid) [Enterobacter kobei]|nr:DUF5431 family protein [Enterobacter kobei]WNP36916.1 DUF5431 family protein [Enterobacter kobei]
MTGGVNHETAAKRLYLVRINRVFNAVNIHIPDPEIALRNSLQGRRQGGGGFSGLRIR